ADTVVIARTDAVAVDGIDAAIDRAGSFVEAGADVVFVEALEDVQQLRRVSDALPGVPLVFNAVEGGRSPMLDATSLAGTGVRLLLHPISLLLATISAQQDALAALRDGRSATSATIALARTVVGADDALAHHHPTTD
ncbi:MAG: isocitrate lyase/phosphoenolpyruvate mutase family protein, partial [Ilumatobacteraceae bacterium]